MEPKGPHSSEEATENYRTWLGTKLTLTDEEWKRRKKRVAESTPFEFLRATFYRWSQWWPTVCEGLDNAPLVLGVGDVHVENFGTWRDAEGRLVWGINDFDEAADIPYPFDLVRLATSAFLIPHSPLPPRDVANAIHAGYSDGLADPRPTLLAETPLRKLIIGMQ